MAESQMLTIKDASRAQIDFVTSTDWDVVMK